MISAAAAVSGVAGLSPVSPSGIGAAGSPALPRSAPGGDAALFQQLLQRTNAQTWQADAAVEQLLTGQTTDVHNVIVTLAKADLSFRFLMEVRNRLIDAYQEIMRMQV